MVAPARWIATRVLHRVVKDDAWAVPALDAEIGRAHASRADAALATQIVYGTLRVLPELDDVLRRQATKPIKVDAWTRSVLLSAVFQLLHLGRVPAHAIVDDAVGLVRDKRGKRMAGFANAILRKIARDRPIEPQPPTTMHVPRWLHDSLEASIGADRVAQLLHVTVERPSIDLRVRADLDREAVGRAISRARPKAAVAPTSLSPRGLRVSGAGDPRELPGYADGHFAVQEEGAQLIGWLLDVQPGDRVLDACAGRGGKTAQLIEAAGSTGDVTAVDLYAHRLEQIPDQLARLHLRTDTLRTACVDWTVGAGAVRGLFDRVLVDAPCTGLGTLRRRPEILLRAKQADGARMGEIQRRILQNVAPMVRPGGILMYAVCSPLVEEGARVLAGVDLSGFELVMDSPSCLKSLRFGTDGRLDLGPWVAGAGPWADAYQVYVWVHVG